MANPKLILRRDRQHNDGKCPIILQLYIKRIKVAITLSNMEIDPKDWDEAKQQVKKSHPDYKDRNLELQSNIGKAIEILKEYRLAGSTITPAAFKREFRSNATRQDFIAYMRAKIENEYQRHIISPATKVIHLNSAAKLEAYAGRVMFADISREWIENFDAWHAKLQERKGNEGLRAREKVFKTVRKYLKMAEGDGKKFKDPFNGLVWPRSKSRPVFLTQDELMHLLHCFRYPDFIERECIRKAKERKLSDHHTSQYLEYAINRIHNTLRCFLWQCLTGMRYDDARTIKHRDIETDGKHRYLVFVPKKTENTSGVEVRMLITDVIAELIQGRVGAILDTPPNAKYNLRLKEMADVLGISKHLTTHVGRHTFATVSLERGMSVEVLMELMGLTKLDTLMVYVHLTSKRRDEEMNDTWIGI